jgi:hypothetical protein
MTKFVTRHVIQQCHSKTLGLLFGWFSVRDMCLFTYAYIIEPSLLYEMKVSRCEEYQIFLKNIKPLPLIRGSFKAKFPLPIFIFIMDLSLGVLQVT